MSTIDLDVVTNKGEVKNLAGKPRGEAARKHFDVDALDAGSDAVTVKVPDYIYAISSSFFLGLFSRSVLKFGSADAFLGHYRFQADDSVMRQVLHAIDRCLITRGDFTPVSA